MLKESTAVLLANSTHIGHASNKLAQEKMNAYLTWLFTELKRLSKGTVGYKTSCAAVAELKCTDPWKMVCLETLV